MEDLSTIPSQARRLILTMTTRAGSGHVTSSLSCVEILVSLFGSALRYDPSAPQNLYNDRFVLSKGHGAPALYALYSLAHWISPRELDSLRQKGSRLEGHPTRALPYIDVGTGSLGQGLAIGMGMAHGLSDLDPQPRVYVLLGDGELAEGSVWEALALTYALGIRNICAIVDLNGLGQSGPSLYDHNPTILADRICAFGWKTHVVDGHDLAALTVAFTVVTQTPGPHCIIAKTVKGKGVSFLEGKPNWHGKALTEEQLQKALQELPPAKDVRLKVEIPLRTGYARKVTGKTTFAPKFAEATATKYAFGLSVADASEQNGDVIVLDADVKNSTRTDLVAAKTPEQFIELSIAESTMVGMATGLDVVGKRAVVSTFAAFLTRSYDQLRIAALSSRSLVINGSYAGVSIGRDGASQMGLEDIAMMRALPGCSVVYPSDAYSAYMLTQEAIRGKGMWYIRTTREPTPLLYQQGTSFPLGGCHLHGPSDQDKVTLVSAGITLFEALRTQEILREQGILVRVIDLYSVKPIDVHTLAMCARATSGRLVVIEDHRPEGGIGEAVRTALDGIPLMMKHLAVVGVPHSASPQEELAIHGIDAESIVRAAKELL